MDKQHRHRNAQHSEGCAPVSLTARANCRGQTVVGKTQRALCCDVLLVRLSWVKRWFASWGTWAKFTVQWSTWLAKCAITLRVKDQQELYSNLRRVFLEKLIQSTKIYWWAWIFRKRFSPQKKPDYVYWAYINSTDVKTPEAKDNIVLTWMAPQKLNQFDISLLRQGQLLISVIDVILKGISICNKWHYKWNEII